MPQKTFTIGNIIWIGERIISETKSNGIEANSLAVIGMEAFLSKLVEKLHDPRTFESPPECLHENQTGRVCGECGQLLK